MTANQRAARSLRRAHAAAELASGKTLWTPPQILPLETWLASLWSSLMLEGHETRMLLNRTQEHALWRAVIAADENDAGPKEASIEAGSQGAAANSNLDALANLAAGALRLLHLYPSQQRLRDSVSTTDARAFLRWSEAFTRRCRREAFLPAAELPASLGQALSAGTLNLPQRLVLIDIDQLTPAAAQLFASIEAAGYDVQRLSTAQQAEVAELHPAEDDSAELRQAAAWARERFAARPDARVAIVVPNLADRQAEIDRAFARVLPESTYEFSLGQPLAQTAVVAAALDLLRWPAEPLSLRSISALLLSPVFGASAGPLAPESLAVADFDMHVLRRNRTLRPEWTLEAFTHLAVEADLPLVRRLRALHREAAAEQIGTGSARQSYAEWTDSFRKLLEAVGWTAAAARDSFGFQIHRRWESVLDEVATLDFASAPVTAAEVLAAIARLAAETIFAPESHDAPIQILGPLELGGLPFDALRFLSADDLTWPSIPVSHPLLPFALQRAAGMPGASPSQDAARARALTERIAQSAPQVAFSFGTRSEEGERRPSPLLRALNLATHRADDSAAAAQPEEIQPYEIALDEAALPERTGAVRGGAEVLKDQAACAFRAFAVHRLFSKEPEARAPGLDPGERGSLVHRVMESLWEQLHSQDELGALSTVARNAVLDAVIDAAISRDSARARADWDKAYLRVQVERLRALLRPWLDVELNRPRFSVAASERSHKARIGPLELDLRVDRIDETAAGNLLLDYKTGASAPAEWLSDRPDAPQLPLYAILPQAGDQAEDQPKRLAGVAFALLRAGEDMGLTGFADSAQVFGKPAKMPLPLSQQLEAWREVLTELAEDFSCSVVSVLPKAYPTTCGRCAQRILCRLDPSTLEEFADDPDADFGPTREAELG